MFPELFEPTRIGTLTVKNRLVMPPMGTNLADGDGFVTQRLLDYYEARARGGAGLVIVEVACVHLAEGRAIIHQIGIDHDKFVPGLSYLAEVIKRGGARACIQLHHAGRVGVAPQPMAPSSISIPGLVTPREMSRGEVQETVHNFARAAGRAKAAGFNAVEVHGAHQYLVAQFLSGFSNKRQDEYGGDLEGRARFLLEIIRAVRGEVGPNYPVLVRLSGWEFGLEGGVTMEETREVARWAQRAGADCLDISAYGVGSHAMAMTPEVSGFIAPFAYEVKKAVAVPVIAVGRLTPALAARLLREGRADLVAFGRALIADPELPNKIAQGNLGDIIPCVRCLECLNITFFKRELRCTANPTVGKERELALYPTPHPKRVAVIGSGPAGMAAARASAIQGHQVTLWEKEGRLGGNLNLVSQAPQNARFTALRNYLIRQLKALGVKIELGREANPAAIEQAQPQAVVIATGADPTPPDITGLGQGRVVRAVDVLSGKAFVGEKVVVVGGERVGCQVADFLAEKGKKVTLTKRGPRLATRESPVLRRTLLDRLSAKGVTILTEVRYKEINPQGLVLVDKQGQQRALPADTIVLATGAKPRRELAAALYGKVPEVLVIGDSLQPRGILEAMAEGYQAGRTL